MHVYRQVCNHFSILHYSSLLLFIIIFFCFGTKKMESLLCNEVWLMSPNVQENDRANRRFDTYFVSTKEDFEEAFANFQGKESKYLPKSSYLKLLATDDLVANARFKAVTWIIKSYIRMDLCPETIFGAVNFLDRFISLSQCKEWSWWMFEILSVACLSIANKFYETTIYALHEFKEDLENSFGPSLILRMELTVLKALDWRVDPTTAFSYIHLFTQTTQGFNKALFDDVTKSVAQLLINALLDPKFLEFRQFVVAVSALKTVLQHSFPSTEHYASLSQLETLVPQDYKDDFIQCQRVIQKLMQDEIILECRNACSSPSSPLTMHLFNCCESESPALMNIKLRWSRKRKRGEMEEGL